MCVGRWEGEQLLVQTLLAWTGDFVRKHQELLNKVYVSVTNADKYRRIPSLGAKFTKLL